MPILESIQNSEKKAEEYRENARKEVEELLKKTNSDNSALEEEMIKAAKKTIEENNNKTLESLKELETEIANEQINNNKIDKDVALKNEEKAIDFIINKVIAS